MKTEQVGQSTLAHLFCFAWHNEAAEMAMLVSARSGFRWKGRRAELRQPCAQKERAMAQNVDFRNRLQLFNGLSPAQIDTLFASMRRQVCRTGTTIFECGAHSSYIYLLVEGTVKVFNERPDAEDVILAVCGPGEVLGELNAVDGLGHSASVATLENSVFYVIERDAFVQCLHAMPVLMFNLMLNISRRLRLATQHIQVLARQDVYSRVATQLLLFSEQYGYSVAPGEILIPLRLTQSDLAALIGASRVRVNQALAALKRNKTISIDKNFRIILHNRDALVKHCSPSWGDRAARHDASRGADAREANTRANAILS
ncbi:MAG: family transcriptional regulator, cyclic receptor protein [Abditibacteriota bacterium]|nr:family transcriptional regulator, cyclic receptor protein [Abditibacteriota bacterium]